MLTIRTATVADAPAIGRVLGDAFRDDPTWAQFLPDPATRPEKLARYYRRRVRRHPERVDVAMDDGRLVGALLWAPPERAGGLTAARRTARRATSRFLSRLPGGRGARHTLAVESYRPTGPHWYLRDIGAGPSARGKGVGSALLEHRLGLIDHSGAEPAFLESTTSGSRRLYERFGFEAVGSIATEPDHSSTAMIRHSGARAG
ncbi:GNAT family N-acetyltransferase [Rhodococcus sp. IEGM 1408]|uniref:GNAT family N-acetyltransferase n=1 Tax=Rhodococcus sp. IEGM 1408 TaxID=3082220 RepID=UPI002955356A|nr:GNAT family N-acetyltransferase [Rhodococcus sp. IEGM 1408]MDV8001060.1 GNAT family N-acetyltransferase [Rhodococcus sp. IEGM 1408]